MNIHTLRKFSSYIQSKTPIKLKLIKRVGDNLFYVNINNEIFYFDLTRGKSCIFISEEIIIPTKNYNAPFDTSLSKLSNATILDSKIDGNNRILQTVLQIQNSYKSEILTLQIEFTGKNTNLIILQDRIIKDALHHISSDISFREIKINKPLLDLPQANTPPKDKDEGDLFVALKNNFIKITLHAINAKKQKLQNKLVQKINQLTNNLSLLKDKETLEQSAKMNALYGHKILEHIHNLHNFKGQEITLDGITIPLPKESNNLSMAAQIFFKQSKKESKKAQNLHKQVENIKSKIEFYNNLTNIINNSSNVSDLDIIDSNLKQKQNNKKDNKSSAESFFIEGFKISIGKNKKENIELLENAKADDFWMHIKNIPSSHLIIHCGKNKIPVIIINKAAELLVSYYKGYSGRYEVDYTKRKFVKITDGSKVIYGKESTIVISKD